MSKDATERQLVSSDVEDNSFGTATLGRREFMKRTFILAGSGVLAASLGWACGDDSSSESETPASAASTTSGTAPAAATGAAQSPEAATDKRGGTLNLFTSQTIGRIDPLTTQSNYLTVLAYNTFGQLVHYKTGTWDPAPDLADRWDVSEDGLSYTFHLRPDLKFHDGSSITLDDVVYSLQRIQSPISVWKAQFAGVKDIKADESTNSVVVTLDGPDLFLLAKMAGIGGSVIVPKAVVDKYGDQFATTVENTIGAGPFRLTEKSDTQLVWERFDDFYEPAFVDKIVMKVIPDSKTQQLEFDAGHMDWISSIQDVDQANKYKNDSKFANTYKEYLAPAVNRFEVNPSMKPFDDERVRQAIIMAIDPQMMADIGGLSKPAYSLIHPDLPGYTEREPYFPKDPPQAKDLLSQAGYGDGFSTDFYIYNNQRYLAQVQVMQQSLADIGIKLNIKTSDFGTFMSEVVKKNYPFFFALANVLYPDSAQYIYDSFDTKGPFNSGYSNPDVDEQLEQALAENSDPDKRAELAAKADDLIMKDAAVIYVWDRIAAYVFQPWIRGIEDVVPIYPRVRLNTVWIDPTHR